MVKSSPYSRYETAFNLCACFLINCISKSVLPSFLVVSFILNFSAK
ncbi:hypothetical protein BAZSYMA_ACONTIG03627_12 [Bathymodiolus azoricus thioautotrophic gill symbiont]|uniref:Uncharacterized protein n=1 Tax=Bathymodiolus azoricus thioautotrophic gill symbiont TaxID=235205 RepID=A0A1H6K6W2_9GAMM|nr:hypothetical protein BAZSYMA_ACONTIG03627_12 [Bathymodiolus azoricus thioautotrophic gill symbiont]